MQVNSIFNNTNNISESPVSLAFPQATAPMANAADQAFIYKNDASKNMNVNDYAKTGSLLADENARKMEMAEELGLIEDSDSPEDFVTVSDRIQIEMAIHGDKTAAQNVSDAALKAYAGDNLSSQAVVSALESYDVPVTEEVLSAVDSAVEKVETAGTVSDEAARFMVKNNMLPTLGNAYMAKYSASGAFSLGSSAGWEQVKGQVEELLTKAGITPTDEIMNSAKELFNADIPVTPENVWTYQALKDNDAKSAESWAKELAQSYITTGSFEDAFVIGETSFFERAEAISITVTRIEASLVMTASSAAVMIKNGIIPEIAEREQLLDAVRRILLQNMEEFESDVTKDKASLSIYNDTLNALYGLGSSPAGTLGLYISEETISYESFTLESFSSEASVISAKYEKMSMTYEAVGTEVRGDLGDSIKKAFKNMDSLLDELGLDNTEETKRAARILSYNQMELTEGNIDKVKELALELKKLQQNLTPQAVLSFIKDGINPLNTSIYALNDALDEMNAANPSAKAEDYAKFLYKLDNQMNEVLTDAERQAYIGIYRLMHLAEKDDYAAIGFLENSGEELTLNNLIKAVKSKRAGGVDEKAGDFTAELKEIYSGNNLNQDMLAISRGEDMKDNGESRENRQEKAMISLLRRYMSPEGINKLFKAGDDIGEMSLERFFEAAFKAERQSVYSEELEIARALRYFEATDLSSESIKRLMESGQGRDLFINALKKLKPGKDSVYSDFDKEDELPKETENILEASDDETALASATAETAEALTEVVNNKLDFADLDKLDIKELKSEAEALSIAKSLAPERRYHIPVEEDGSVIGVNLTIKTGNEGEKGAKISMNFEALGSVEAEIQKTNDTISLDVEIENNIDNFKERLTAAFTEDVTNLAKADYFSLAKEFIKKAINISK